MQLHTLIDSASDAIISVDSRHCITVFNRAAVAAFGWSEAEILGQPLSVLLPPLARPAHSGQVEVFAAEDGAWRRMAGERPRLHGLRKDGTLFPAEVTISKARVHGQWMFTAIVRDISERHAYEERLRRLSLYDPLTGLANRSLMSESLTAALKNITRPAAVALLFIDIDRFKRINDGLGHAAGDELLTLFATRLQAAVRKKDVVARFGGDEFVVLAETDPDQHSAIAIATRLLDAWSRPFAISNHATNVTASVGIGIARTPNASPEALMREADVALHRAKDRGRNRIELFDPASGGWAADRLELERDLQHAAKRGEFELHYQPLVNLTDSTITGFEALLRWRRDGRLIPPADFIPLAEETGQICQIGAWVLDRACEDAVRFRAAGGRDIDMAVNLSLRQLLAPALADDVQRVLHRTGLPAEGLTLEVTETFMVQDSDSVLAVLHEVRALGVHLALDDFGTGYSSLSHLRRIPVTTVKVDRSFMTDVTTPGSEDHTIVSSIVALGHALQLTVITEGIETRDQAEMARILGADRAQGFLYSPAVPAAKAVELLAPPLTPRAAVLRLPGARTT
jgi:diguanylate cyclase (GGDEF)-like protein/PAS domain S-box-containing protein